MGRFTGESKGDVMEQHFHYGGQAVMEGVMIRGQKEVAVAVRDPAGEIVYHTEPLNAKLYNSKVAKMPFARGLVMLWDMLVLGMRMLVFSANIAVSDQVNDKGEKEEIGGPMLWLSVLLGIAFAVGLFFLAPLLLSGILDSTVGKSWLSNLAEGVLRLGLLIGYLYAIGKMPDIRRVFSYHGAEHKVINAYEDGIELEVEGVQRYSTAHPRCGTGFLLVVVLISILVFTMMGRPPMMWMILSRIVFVPIIAAVAYEFIKFTARHRSNPIVRATMAPGLALQALTTREPDGPMVEVAIAALRKALAADGVVDAATEDRDVVPSAKEPVPYAG